MAGPSNTAINQTIHDHYRMAHMILHTWDSPDQTVYATIRRDMPTGVWLDFVHVFMVGEDYRLSVDASLKV